MKYVIIQLINYHFSKTNLQILFSGLIYFRSYKFNTNKIIYLKFKNKELINFVFKCITKKTFLHKCITFIIIIKKMECSEYLFKVLYYFLKFKIEHRVICTVYETEQFLVHLNNATKASSL